MSELDNDPEITLKRSEILEMIQQCTSETCEEVVRAALKTSFENFASAIEKGTVLGLESEEEKEMVKSVLVKIAGSARHMAKGFEAIRLNLGEPE